MDASTLDNDPQPLHVSTKTIDLADTYLPIYKGEDTLFERHPFALLSSNCKDKYNRLRFSSAEVFFR
jgi:hypothetical protein